MDTWTASVGLATHRCSDQAGYLFDNKEEDPNMALKNTERREAVMARSIKLGHCVCNPKQACPCEIFTRFDVCQCAGERVERELPGQVRLTQHVRKAGCASKISQADLKKVIEQLPVFDDPRVLVGVNACDDAGVVAFDENVALVQTVDVFSPVVDDPYMFGRISAANSLSDVYAMGGAPLSALTVIGFPIESMSHDVMAEILRGGADTMREAGVVIVGGHSINDDELKCGFAVTGTIDPRRIVGNNGAWPGDALVLTKPLGVGVIAFAAQIGRAPADVIENAQRSMTALNKTASELMLRHAVHACTDVTGFGLLGHLTEMARRSGATARVDASRAPLFAGAVDLVRAGIMGGGVDANRDSAAQFVSVEDGTPEEAVHLFYDAQTSGGLLVALPADEADAYVRELREAGVAEAARIGEIVPKGTYPVEIRRGAGTLSLHGPRAPEEMTGGFLGPAAESGASVSKGKDGNSPCCGSQEGRESDPNDSDASGGARENCCASPSGETGQTPVSASPSGLGSSAGKTSAGGSDRIRSVESRFVDFMKTLNGPGALDTRTKKLMAIALAAVTRCEPCLAIHLESGRAMGLTQDEIDEAIWMAISFGGAPIKMFYEAFKIEHKQAGE